MSTDGQMDKQNIGSHTGEYYSTIKKNEDSHCNMNVENIMLSEVSHKRPHIVRFHSYETPEEEKTRQK